MPSQPDALAVHPPGPSGRELLTAVLAKAAARAAHASPPICLGWSETLQAIGATSVDTLMFCVFRVRKYPEPLS